MEEKTITNEITTEPRMVKVEELSNEGHTEHILLPTDAVEFVKKQIREEGKWGFIDGEYVNTETLTEDDLLEANQVLLTHMLAGGEMVEDKKVITYRTVTKISELDEDDTGDVLIDIVDDQLTITADKDCLAFILRNTKIYSNRLHAWLLAEARKEVANVAHEVGQDFNADYVSDETEVEAAITGIKVIENNKLEHAVSMIYEASEDELEICFNKKFWYPLLHARDYIAKTIYDKLLSYGQENIDMIKKAVNY